MAKKRQPKQPFFTEGMTVLWSKNERRCGMSREMTNKEAIANLNHLIYGIVSPDIQRSLDLAIKALEERPQGEWVENLDRLGLSYICPFCGHEITGILQDLNYCCKCGADMRGIYNGKEKTT